MRLSVTLSGGDELNSRLGRAVKEISTQVVTQAIYGVQNEIKLNLGGRILKVRTGGLMRAWSQPPVIGEEGGEAVGRLRANSQYAAIHEYGGDIRPVRAQNLTIPLRAAQTGAGLPRFRAYEVFAAPGQYGFRHVWVNRAKTAILGIESNRDRTPVALFALLKSVTMPARHYVSDALEAVRAKLPAMIESVTMRVARSLGLMRG